MRTRIQTSPRTVELVREPLAAGVELARVLAAVPRDLRPILLEGPTGRPADHEWLCFDPVETCDEVDSLLELRARLAGWRATGARPSGPFSGGFVGALAYDLGVAGERLALPVDPWGWPRILGGVYTDFLHVDRRSGAVELVLGDAGAARAPLAARRERVHAWIATCADHDRADGGRDDGGRDGRAAAPKRRVDAQSFRRAVERVRESIADGCYYQANLSHRITARFAGDSLALYARLRRANPAPYMAYLEHPAGAICSSSPELLFEYDGTVARSRPIKGTCRRRADPDEDERARRDLLASAKDRAELAMIVDLVRNDLGRVARIGGVRVPELFQLETYTHVHHLVATVEARVRERCDAFDVLAALFPGGSITGAPKLAAMRAIAELEGEGRGPFTGSLGMLGFDGRARFNILIRTLLARPDDAAGCDVSFRVGGGITHRSDPRAEDEETMAKAQGLLDALGSNTGARS